MKVAIIGAGNVGKALAGTARRAGHDVTLADSDGEKSREAAAEVGASAAATAAQAASGADVVVLAVPFGALDDVAREVASEVAGKVVIDVTNPLKPDYSGPALEGTSAAEQLAERLPNARVAKAFNTLFSSIQADPKALGTTIDALYATSDEDARRTVPQFIQSLGFRPVDVGSLDGARQLEALAWLNMRMQMQYDGDWRSTFVVVDPPAAAVHGAQ